MPDIKTALVDFVVAELLEGDAQAIADEPNLLQSDIIDSIGVMRLIAFMEQEFGLEIPPEDVTLEHFLNFDVMSDYLRGRGVGDGNVEPTP